MPADKDIGEIDQRQRLAHVVVADEHAHAALLEGEDGLLEFADGQRIDAGEWLVEQDIGGIDGEGAGDLAAAALAARQPSAALAADFEEAEFGEDGLEPLLAPAPARLGGLEIEHDVVLDGQADEDRILLRQIGEAEPRARVDGQGGDVAAVDADGAAVGRVMPVIMLMMVVLPAPFGPSSAMISPRPISSPTSATTSRFW